MDFRILLARLSLDFALLCLPSPHHRSWSLSPHHSRLARDALPIMTTTASTDDHGDRTSSPTASTFSTETANAIATLPEDSSAYDDAKSKATSIKSAARSSRSKLVELEDEETASIRSEGFAKSPTTSTAPILAVTAAEDELQRTPTRGVTPEQGRQSSQVDEVEESEKPLPVLPGASEGNLSVRLVLTTFMNSHEGLEYLRRGEPQLQQEQVGCRNRYEQDQLDDLSAHQG